MLVFSEEELSLLVDWLGFVNEVDAGSAFKLDPKLLQDLEEEDELYGIHTLMIDYLLSINLIINLIKK